MLLLFTFANFVARSLSRFVDVPRKNWPSPLGSYLLPFSGIVPGKAKGLFHYTESGIIFDSMARQWAIRHSTYLEH